MLIAGTDLLDRTIEADDIFTFIGGRLASRFIQLSPRMKPTLRRSKMHGPATSEAEVTNISAHGFWLLLRGEELFVPSVEFPWFKKAAIDQIISVEWPSQNHLYWPQLDIDLSVNSIRNPNAFPLLAKP